MVRIKKSIYLLIHLGIISSNAILAQNLDWKTDKKAGFVFGLTQPIFVSGFNIEGVYVHKRIIFDYSHGASLKFTGDALTETLRNQQLEVHAPFTTGFGVGYRFTKWVNLRVEPKWHRFNFYYEGEQRIAENRITSNNTFNLGLGLYGLFQPFEKKTNALKGITIAPSIRYWPTLSSNINESGFSYQNKLTGRNETLQTLDPGFGFTPWIFNISIGYIIDFKRNKN